MQDKVSCAERIRDALSIRNITQSDLCRMTGIPKSAMSQYCKGSLVPRQIRIHMLALSLDVSEAWLMGYDVPTEREKSPNADDDRLKGIMSVLGEIGALSADGSLSDRGCEVVTNMLSNNADMLKKFINDET